MARFVRALACAAWVLWGCGDSATDTAADTATVDIGDVATQDSVADVASMDAGDGGAVDVVDASPPRDGGADSVDAGQDAAEADISADTGMPVQCAMAAFSGTASVDGRFEHLDGIDGVGIAPRRVTVYLPPDYAAAPERRYPVLYMHDGQNLFFDALSFAGEWGVDEAVDAGVTAGVIEPVIVVGVYNTADRLGDYTPTVDPGFGGGNAAAYADYLADVLKPVIDGRYRTRCGREDTGVAGSSLAGLASLFIAMRHADTFGRVGAVSPSLWWDGGALIDDWEAFSGPFPTRLWTDMGSEEGSAQTDGGVPFGVENVRRVRARALARGMVLGDDLGYREHLGAGHNEGAWRNRLPSILRILYGTPPLPAADSALLGFYKSTLAGSGSVTGAAVDTLHGGTRVTQTNTDVSFSASPDDVITIAADGGISALGAGTTTVSATVAGHTATQTITVGVGAGPDVTVVFNVNVPASTPAQDVVYIAGSRPELGDWNPGLVAMTAADSNAWTITLALSPGPIEYKFTRGDWATVETQANGADIGNRMATVVDAETLSHTVSGWKAQ